MMIRNRPCPCPIPRLPQDTLTPLIFLFYLLPFLISFPCPLSYALLLCLALKWREEPLRNLWADGTLSLNVSPLSPLLSTAFPFQALLGSSRIIHEGVNCADYPITGSSPCANSWCVCQSINSAYWLFAGITRHFCLSGLFCHSVCQEFSNLLYAAFVISY